MTVAAVFFIDFGYRRFASLPKQFDYSFILHGEFSFYFGPFTLYNGNRKAKVTADMKNNTKNAENLFSAFDL